MRVSTLYSMYNRRVRYHHHISLFITSLDRKLTKLTINEKFNINGLTKSDKPKHEISGQFNIPSYVCVIITTTFQATLQNEDNVLHKYENNKGSTKRMKISEYSDIEVS